MNELPLSRPCERRSDYIGTAVTWESAGVIRAQVQPLSDGTAAEMYGVKLSRSVQLLCESADIRERDRVEWRGGSYIVKGVTAFGNIVKAVAELDDRAAY